MTLFIHLANRAFGRVVAADVKDPITGELLFKQGDVIDREDIEQIADSAVIKIFSSFCVDLSSKTWCLCSMLWL